MVVRIFEHILTLGIVDLYILTEMHKRQSERNGVED